MHPPTRSQTDGLGDIASLDSGLDCSNLPDLARQEFKDEVDVNIMLRKFGIPIAGPLQFGEIDYDLDLQQAHAAVNVARKVHNKMPQEIKDKYPTWGEFLTAVVRGDVALDLKENQPPASTGDPPAPPPTP